MNLQQAIACYTAALRVRTVDLFPVDWASTTANLALAEQTISCEWQAAWSERGWNRQAMRQNALQGLEAAIAVFRLLGDTRRADQFTQWFAQFRGETTE